MTLQITMSKAREIAHRIWEDKDFKGVEKDEEVIDKIARLLYRLSGKQAWLNNLVKHGQNDLLPELEEDD